MIELINQYKHSMKLQILHLQKRKVVQHMHSTIYVHVLLKLVLLRA